MPRELLLGPNAKLAGLCARRTFWTPKDDLNKILPTPESDHHFQAIASMHCRIEPDRLSNVLDIYADLLKTVETLTTHLLKDNLLDASLIRSENEKVFAKLNEVAEAAEQRRSTSPAAITSTTPCHISTSFSSRPTDNDGQAFLNDDVNVFLGLPSNIVEATSTADETNQAADVRQTVAGEQQVSTTNGPATEAARQQHETSQEQEMTNVETTGKSDQGKNLPTSERAEKRHLPPQQPPPPSLCTPLPPPPPPPPPPPAGAAAAAAAAESSATAGTIPATNADMSAGRRRMVLRSDIAGNVASQISSANFPQSPADTESETKIGKKRKRASNKTSTPNQVPPKQSLSLSRIANRFGSVDQRGQVEEIAGQLHAHADGLLCLEVLEQVRAPPMSESNPGDFLQALPRLRRRLQRNSLRERISRILKRIDLAQFYDYYTLAQNNPDTFLQLTEQLYKGSNTAVRVLRKTRKASMVKQRFVDILFSKQKGESQDSVSIPGEKLTPKQITNMVGDWRTLGKAWSKFITRLGYKALIIAPDELSDET